MKKIIDYFTYYDPMGQELLQLRYNILKDVVDHFVVCESNRTMNGDPVEYKLKDRLVEFNLPLEKFTIIYNEIPENDDLEILEVDRLNSNDNQNINSYRSRARERMQKEGIHKILESFDEDTFFIVSDIDEIIKPECIDYLMSSVKQYPDCVIKVPLMYMEGKANLRVYYKSTMTPKIWDGAAFVCQKHHLQKTTVIRVRSNIFNPFPVVYLTQDNKRIEDMGWHFTWMGDFEKRKAKLHAYAHRDESYSFLTTKSFNSAETLEHMSQDPEPGALAVSCEADTTLVLVPDNELPQALVNDPKMREYFLYKQGTDNSYSVNVNTKPKIWIVEDFYQNPDFIRKFALEQEYVEGGFGRGFIGRRTEKQFLFPGLKEAFEKIMGMKITAWESYSMNGRFQSCWAGEPLVYHCDVQRWAATLYLTPDAPYECGTTSWAHKKTRIRHNSHPDIMSTFRHESTLDRTPYEPVDVLGNVYNRLVIFDAGLIHSASEYFGFNKENGRLWQMFFFD